MTAEQGLRQRAPGLHSEDAKVALSFCSEVGNEACGTAVQNHCLVFPSIPFADYLVLLQKGPVFARYVLSLTRLNYMNKVYNIIWQDEIS